MGVYFGARSFLYSLLGGAEYRQLIHHDLSGFAAPLEGALIPLVLVRSLTGAIAEELVCRAYLITRIEQMSGSTFIAWMLSSGIFGAYHIYQGWGGVISATLVGLVYGLAFCYLRRVWPVAIAHTAEDLLFWLSWFR